MVRRRSDITLSRISNFRKAQIEILPSHKERGQEKVPSTLERGWHEVSGEGFKFTPSLPSPSREGIIPSPCGRWKCEGQKFSNNVILRTESEEAPYDGSFADGARIKRMRYRFHPLLAPAQDELRNSGEGNRFAFTLAEGAAHAAMPQTKAKFAFTLAEVLITLGVIGVVAAMTIPNLNVYLKGKRLESQFKKTYSELNQATRTFYADTDMPLRDYQDSVYDGTWTSTKSLAKFMEYYKGVTTNTSWSPRQYDNLHNLKNLNLNNQEIAQWPCDQSKVFVDMVGRLYTMDDNATYYNLSYGPKICVDINGNTKPNKWGVDRFVFVFTDNNSIVPYTGNSWNSLSVQLTDEDEIAKYCSTETSNVVHTCAYFALKNKSPDGKGSYWYDFIKDK